MEIVSLEENVVRMSAMYFVVVRTRLERVLVFAAVVVETAAASEVDTFVFIPLECQKSFPLRS